MAIIDELRAKSPQKYGTMTDRELADHIYSNYYATEMPRDAFYKQLGVDIPKSSWAEIIARDIPLALGQGLVTTYEAPKELLGLTPFTKGKIPKAIESAEQAVFGGTSGDLQRYLESLKSEGQQFVSEEAQNIPSTGNILRDTTGQLLYAAQHPQQIPQIVAQSLPSTFEGGFAGKGIQSVGKRFGKEISDIGAAASGEGLVAAGAGSGAIRQQTENKELSGGQQAIAAVSGYITNKLGRVGNRAAQYLGVDDMDVLAVRLGRGNLAEATDAAALKAKSKLLAGLKSALSESVFEELPQSAQEQISQNIALGRPWDEGVAEQMAGGIIGGAGAGFGFGAYNQYRLNKLALGDVPPPTDSGAEPPGIDIKVPKTDTKQNAKTRKEIIDSAEDEEAKKSLEELLSKPKKGQPSGTQQTTAGTSDEVSGGSADGTTGGTKKPVGGGVDGATTDELTDKTGEGRSDVTLEPITKDNLGKSFVSTGQAHKFRRENKLQDSYSVEKQTDGTIALVPKIPVTEQKTPAKQTKAPEVTEEKAAEDIEDEEIGWEKFEETKPDGTTTSGFRRKQTTAEQDAPVVKIAKTPKSTEVLKSEAELTEADKADMQQEEADEDSARQSRIDDANNKEGIKDQPDYVKTGSLLAESSPVEKTDDPNEARRIAVKHAAFDQAMDEFDSASIEDFDSELKRLSDEQKAKTGKEFSINRPLEFMKGLTQAQRLNNYYKLFNQFLGKKKLPPRRSKQANVRNDFLNTLSKEERKLFNKAYSRYITTEVKAMKSGVATVGQTETDEQALYRKLQKEIELVSKGKGSQAKVDKYKADYAAARERSQKASVSRQVIEADTSETSNRVTNLEQAIKDGENEIKSIKVAKKIKDKAAQIKAVQTQLNKNRAELKRAKAELEAAKRVTTVLGAPGRYTNVAEESADDLIADEEKQNTETLEQAQEREALEVEKQAKIFAESENKKTQKQADEKEKKKPKITVAAKLNQIISKGITQGKNIKEILTDLYDGKNQQKYRSYQRTALLFSEVLDRLQKKGYKLPNIEFGVVLDNRPGMYNPATNTITINIESNQEYGRVVVHETLHYLLDHIVEEYQKNPNSDLLSAAQKVYLKALVESYEHALPQLGEKYNNMPFKEFLAQAVEGMEFSIALGKIDPLPGRVIPFLKDLARSIAGMLGFRIEHGLPAVDKGAPATAYVLEAVLNDIESILTGNDYVSKSDKELRLLHSVDGDISFAGDEDSGDTEEAGRTERTANQIIEGFSDPGLVAKKITQKIKSVLPTSQDAIDTLATDFSNSRWQLEKLQENMVRSGEISYDDDTFNNFYDYFSTAFGKAQWYVKHFISNPRKHYTRSLTNFAKANNYSFDYAAKVLKGYTIAFHATERRKTKWLLNVPLEKLNKIKFKTSYFGVIEDTPANIREFIFQKVSDPAINNLSVEQATAFGQAMQADLIRLVNRKGSVVEGNLGYSPAGYKKTDITSPDYNVIEDLNFNDEQALKAKYMAESDRNKVLVQQYFTIRNTLLKATKDLNREAGYWSKGTDSIIGFYGWKNYAPFKVRPGDKAAFKLNIEGSAFGRTGKDYTGSRFEGSVEDTENPVTQVLVEAVQSAARFGGRDALRAVRNAVKQGYIQGHLLNFNGKPRKKTEIDVPTYTFQDRYTGKVDDALLKRQNVIYVYNPNGSMDLIEITNQKQLEAIRRTYAIENDQWVNKFWTGLAWATSKTGQWHTRLNLGFPPYNFQRDVFTNAGIIAVRENPAVAARILTAAAIELAGVRGISKAAKFSYLFHNDNIEEINKLAKKDLFYQALKEYGENGGSVSIVQGLSANSAMDLLRESMKIDVKGNLNLTSDAQISKYFDIYGSMFEFAARIAVYKVLKSHFYDQLKKQYVSYTPAQLEKAAIIKAVAYTKNLANFEEVGNYGKKLGSYFMFFRASSTGNRVAYKALAPAFRSIDAVANTLPKVTQDNPVAMERFKKSYAKDKKYARLVSAFIAGIGLALWYGLRGLADDDEDKDEVGRNRVATDDARRWVRNARVYLGYDPKTHKNVVGNIAWGFGPSAFMGVGAQIGAFTGGDNLELKDFMINMGLIGLDSFIPIQPSQIDPTENPVQFGLDTLSPSVIKPFIEYSMNLNAIDQPIYRNSTSKYARAYLGTDATPEEFRNASRWFAEKTGGTVNIDASTLSFFANNFFDGVSKMVNSLNGAYMVLKGEKDFDLEKDAFIFDSFLTTTANVDAQRYDTLKKRLDNYNQIYNSYKLNNPDLAFTFSNRTHPNLEMKLKVLNYYENKIINPLRQSMNKITTDRTYSSKERQTLITENRIQQNLMKKYLYDKLKEIDSLSDAEMKNLSNLIDESEAENTIKEFEPDLGY